MEPSTVPAATAGPRAPTTILSPNEISELVARLAKLDSGAVSDALDRLGLGGVLTGLAPLSGPPRAVAGRVVTVELGPSLSTSASRHLGTAAIEAAGPGDVIMVAHQGRLDCAGWGGILSLAAQLRGVEGVIIDGACRDVDEARQLGFPLFASAAVPLTARNRASERSWGEPIAMGNAAGAALVVAPGDLVLADGSGVAVVPFEHAAQIVAAAEDIAAKEAAMASARRGGARPSQVMGASYEELLHPC